MRRRRRWSKQREEIDEKKEGEGEERALYNFD